MRVASLQIINYKSFLGSDEIAFDRLNVLIGPNNGGKSTIIRALYLLQERSTSQSVDVRLGAEKAEFTFKLEDIDARAFQSLGWGPVAAAEVTMDLPRGGGLSEVVHLPDATYPFPRFPASEPDNFIYP